MMATISLYPRMNSTALSLPQHKNLVTERTSFILTRGFPLNHDFLNSNEFTPDTSDRLRDHFQKAGAMPVHTVPLLYVNKSEIKGKDKEVSLCLFDRLSHQVQKKKPDPLLIFLSLSLFCRIQRFISILRSKWKLSIRLVHTNGKHLRKVSTRLGELWCVFSSESALPPV